MRRPPNSTLFPATTLSRLGVGDDGGAPAGRDSDARGGHVPDALAAEVGAAPQVRDECGQRAPAGVDRKSTRPNSSHANISYAVFCLKKKIAHTASTCISLF